MKKAPITAFIYKKIFPSVLLFAMASFGLGVAFLGFAGSVSASVVPTLSLSSLGNGTVQATVSGDADASIQLFYYENVNSSGTVLTAGVIGSTGQNGYLSTTLSPLPNSSTGYYTGYYNSAFSNIPYGALVYVVVNGLQSATVAWPYYYGNGYGNGTGVTTAPGSIYFNPTSISLNVGQSQSVQIYQGSAYENGYANNNYNYASGAYYVSSNINSSVVSASISGSSLSIYAVAPGNTTITVCINSTSYAYPYTSNSNGANGQCATLYVTVNYVNGYSGYPGGYVNPAPVVSISPAVPIAPVIPQIQVPFYIPATVYSAPAYPSYSYSYPTYTTTSAYYSSPTYYPYY